jgi:RES domain-containing protein
MASRSSGPLRAYRIARARHPLFDGKGAALHGGRWNKKGQRVIYGATSFGGALLEILVHSNLDRIPRGFAMIDIEIPEDVQIEEVLPEDLPGWDAADGLASREFGSRWVEEGRTAVLVVPSVPSQGRERNVVINQDHLEFGRIKASRPQKVVWDKRLFLRERRKK